MMEGGVREADLELFESFGGVVRGRLEIVDGFYGEIPAGRFAAYREATGDRLAFADPDAEVKLDLSTSTAQAGARRVWSNLSITGDPMTTVGVVDTGVDPTHAALRSYDLGATTVGLDWSNVQAGDRIVGWEDRSPRGETLPVDTDGHGTHVASIAVGNDPANQNLRGVAPGARLVSARAGTVGTAAGALGWMRATARRHHLIVVNESEGLAAANKAWSDAATKLVEAGVPFVNSAGNEFDDVAPGTGTVNGAPAGPKILSVGAVNNRDQVSFFSSNGTPGNTGANLKPDVVAPGGGRANSIRAADTNDQEPFIDHNGNGRWDGGDRCVDFEGASGWQLDRDLFLDLNDNGVRDANEPFWNLDGIPGYNGGGDRCLDSDGSTTLNGELWFDVDGDGVHDAGGGSNPGLDNYTAHIGTSMAAPHVAGEVALIIDAMTDYAAKDEDGDGTKDEDPWNGMDDDGDGLIDEDPGTWPYKEDLALLVKSLVLMNTFEVPGGETVPAGRPNAGASNDPHRIDGNADNDWQKGGKDHKEGYGRVAVDAAVEAVTEEFCASDSASFGSNANQRKVWTRHLHLDAGKSYRLVFDRPQAADYDLYLYQGMLDIGAPTSGQPVPMLPDRFGEPQLAAPLLGFLPSPVNPPIALTGDAGAGAAHPSDPRLRRETVDFQVPADGLYFLVARRVTGNGQFNVHLVTPKDWTVLVYMPAENGAGRDLDTAAFQALNDMERTGSNGAVQVLTLTDYAARSTSGDAARNGNAGVYCVRKDHDTSASEESVLVEPPGLLSSGAGNK